MLQFNRSDEELAAEFYVPEEAAPRLLSLFGRTLGEPLGSLKITAAQRSQFAVLLGQPIELERFNYYFECYRE